MQSWSVAPGALLTGVLSAIGGKVTHLSGSVLAARILRGEPVSH